MSTDDDDCSGRPKEAVVPTKTSKTFIGVVSGSKVCLWTSVTICAKQLEEMGENEEQCTVAAEVAYCYREAARIVKEDDNEWVNKLAEMTEDLCRIDSDLVRDIIIYGSCVGRSGLPEFMARCSADLPRNIISHGGIDGRHRRFFKTHLSVAY
ncbi:hypothetical protein CEXT_592701 [Caerostris extrusa]|uniref:Uncharacterized protein n=1 Tax=Caerostris extrusa TaxID=172846 RepID=A0AAV4WM23_CAEEX|nr:hypothetical protein CEXT_592701 [Caerostris extrusa]